MKIKDKVEKSIEDVTIVDTITNGKVKSSSSSQASKENSADLSPRKTLSRLRRRKAAIKYDDTDADLFDFDDDDSEFSELEETALSTIDALEISSDISEGGSVCDESDFHDHLDSSEEEGSQFTTQNSTTSIVQVEGVLEYVYYETSLSVVKIFCDWLRINPTVMGFCVESFESMFAHLADLLNTLLALESTVTSVNKGLSSLKYTDLNWEQKYPLTVDRALRNFPGLEKYQSQFIDYSAKRNLSSDEMSFLCIQSLIGFGHFIVNNINKPVLKYDAVANRFIASTDKNGLLNAVVTVETEMPVLQDMPRNSEVTSPNLNANTNGQINSTCSSPEYLTNENGRQKQMMRNMAHLWLKSEVHKLEKAVKGGKIPQLSPYLVLDSCAYMDHLNLVKDLVFSKRFIIVVPKLVLASLDQKKKASANAREAIRWLEAEAQRGSRFIKFLRENERYSLAPMKYPRRKERDAFNFFMLLEYCNYLHQFNSAQIANNNKKELAMVTLLFSSSSTFPANSDALIRSVGMTMERIDVFVSKWRSSMKAKT